MGERRYGISLRVFNSLSQLIIEHSEQVLSGTQEEISHFYNQPCVIFLII